MLYTVHFIAFCLGGPLFLGHGVYTFYNVSVSKIHFYKVSCICI